MTGYPDNPVLVRVRRAGTVESVHRGAWCLADSSGTVLDGGGDWDHPVFVRSAVKTLQALPLLETGAAERFGYRDDELALAMASHSGEPCHTEVVAGTLSRLGLGEGNLSCGVHPPTDGDVRFELRSKGLEPSQLHNNCSGKHAGFLALAKHLVVPLDRYLDPESEGQRLVRGVLSELTDTPPAELVAAVDGCSAPTYRITPRRLATAFARITNPGDLAEPRRSHLVRLTSAARARPELIAGTRGRLDTDLVRATGGRLFPKIGAEAVYAIGVHGADRALALKIDDGGPRGLFALVLGLLRRLRLAGEEELRALASYDESRLRNHAGLEVGSVEAILT